jgi:hypothetical protein
VRELREKVRRLESSGVRKAVANRAEQHARRK